MKIRAAGVVAVLALSLSACGADEEQASKAIADSIIESNDQTFQVTQDQADCVGDGMVEEIGVDKLTDYGIITEDLEPSDGISNVEMSRGDAESAASVMSDCADIMKLFTNAMEQLPAEAKACVEENLTDEVLENFLVAVFMNDQESGTEDMMGALQECLAAES